MLCVCSRRRCVVLPWPRCQSPRGIVAGSVPVAAAAAPAAGDAAAAVVVVICCSSLAAESIESDCPPRPADKVVAATARPTVTAVIE